MGKNGFSFQGMADIIKEDKVQLLFDKAVQIDVPLPLWATIGACSRFVIGFECSILNWFLMYTELRLTVLDAQKESEMTI